MTDVAEGQPVDHDHEPVAPPPPEVPAEVIQTEAAFLMYIDSNGHWVADGAAINRPVQVTRDSNFNDFFCAACVLQKDITAQETANQTVMTQQRVAQQMAERLQTQAIAEQVGGPAGQHLAGLDLSKLRG
jgi:hypothetical protein